jgi:hypothetical protein
MLKRRKGGLVESRVGLEEIKRLLRSIVEIEILYGDV